MQKKNGAQNLNLLLYHIGKKKMKTFKEYSLDRKLDKYVSDEIKKRKLAKFPVNATDDIKMRMKPNKPAF